MFAFSVRPKCLFYNPVRFKSFFLLHAIHKLCLFLNEQAYKDFFMGHRISDGRCHIFIRIDGVCRPGDQSGID